MPAGPRDLLAPLLAYVGHRTVFDLSDPARVAGFTPIDDVVMGGRSWSQVQHESGRLVFSGAVSLEQGGGFASIRSRPERLGLAGCGGLLLRVRGDGRRYKVNLRQDEAFDGVTWQAPFETAAGAWRTVALPFAGFEPRYRGSPRPEAGPLDPAQVVTLGFLVSDRQAGPFRLEVERVGAWEGTDGAPPADG